MAHMVAFYPDRNQSLEIAGALTLNGCSYLEVQFPFSDPTADGIYIQKACDRALRKGFKVKAGFQLVSEISRLSDVPIFIMGYANTVFVYGIERFLDSCLASGVQGIIIPDLPPDYDEGIFYQGKRKKMHIIPVIAPSIENDRLRTILSCWSHFVYTTLRKGITGAYTSIGEENIRFLKKVGGSGKKILAGFGISTKHQIEALAPYVHASVVGTAFIKEIMDSGEKDAFRSVQRKISELL
jgi:tryptophan synthase alpha chain